MSIEFQNKKENLLKIKGFIFSHLSKTNRKNLMISKKTILFSTALALMISQSILPSITLTAGQAPLLGLWLSPLYETNQYSQSGSVNVAGVVTTSNTGATSPVIAHGNAADGYPQFYSQLTISTDNLAAINAVLLSGISVRIEQSINTASTYTILAANVSTNEIIGTEQTYANIGTNISTTNFPCLFSGEATTQSTFVPAGPVSGALPSFIINPAPTSPVFTAKAGKSVTIPVITSPATPPISSFNLSPL